MILAKDAELVEGRLVLTNKEANVLIEQVSAYSSDLSIARYVYHLELEDVLEQGAVAQDEPAADDDVLEMTADEAAELAEMEELDDDGGENSSF